MKPTEHFQRWLKKQSAVWSIGQVTVEKDFLLHHMEDKDISTLKKISTLGDLREYLKVNEQNEFRPLRASPDLRRGWKFGPLDFYELTEALDFIYPAAIANWAFDQEKNLPITQYSETAERQTGRFWVTRNLSDEAVNEVIEEVCVKHCLKRRLWGKPAEWKEEASVFPILCPEACNYFISKAREQIKGED
jgi:hypothetical protein